MLKVDHVCIASFNKRKTIAFYQTLGFKVNEEIPFPEENNVVIIMENADGTMMEVVVYDEAKLSLTERATVKEGVHHYGFITDNIKEVYDKLTAQGIKPNLIRTDTDGRRYFFVNSPGDVKIEFIEENPCTEHGISVQVL